MNQSTLKVGDRVRRRHPWDGSSRAGMPLGPLLSIVKVYGGEPYPIYQLLDGRTEFEFNLCKDQVEVFAHWTSVPADQRAS